MNEPKTLQDFLVALRDHALVCQRRARVAGLAIGGKKYEVQESKHGLIRQALERRLLR